MDVAPIPALLPRDRTGHQFVLYADSCSGVPGALHESTFAAVNQIVARLAPQPEFICFPGDEIIGLTADDEALRQQWQHWFDVEMAWLDASAIPLYHTTGNHTVYDSHSETIYRQVMNHLPRNGPTGQEGLSYFVRRGDLLLIFTNTLNLTLGGEGRVETTWLEQTLIEHADAHHKLVFGHHPVFSVNGFVGEHGRDIDTAMGQTLWSLLIEHGVLAYVCSHILAFDVQVHDGVLQILTAGAGTAHRMPEGVEYLHCVQAALDQQGLRYQVLDTDGAVREQLAWPLNLGMSSDWDPLSLGLVHAPYSPKLDESSSSSQDPNLICWRFSGVCSAEATGTRQTLLSAWNEGTGLAPLWIGLAGIENRLSILLAPTPGRSPHLWTGPALQADQPFDIQVALHGGMGPGGVLWRWDDDKPWSSLHGSSAWGVERLSWPSFWSIGRGQRGETDFPFLGHELRVKWHEK
ncbi:MAG: hypothetical protein AAF702_36200 [Chloroflexota bacterium]